MSCSRLRLAGDRQFPAAVNCGLGHAFTPNPRAAKAPYVHGHWRENCADMACSRPTSPMFEGQFSPHLNLRSFPSARQASARWPANTVVTDFPFMPEPQRQSRADLVDFLVGGDLLLCYAWLGGSFDAVTFTRKRQGCERSIGTRAPAGGRDARNRTRIQRRRYRVFDYAPYSLVFHVRSRSSTRAASERPRGASVRAARPLWRLRFDQPTTGGAERLGWRECWNGSATWRLRARELALCWQSRYAQRARNRSQSACRARAQTAADAIERLLVVGNRVHLW